MTQIISILLLTHLTSIQDRIGAVDIPTATRLIISLLERNQRLDGSSDGYEGMSEAKAKILNESAGMVLMEVSRGFGSFDTFTGLPAKLSMSDNGFYKRRRAMGAEGITAEACEAAFREILGLVGIKNPVKILECDRKRKDSCEILALPEVGERTLSPAFLIQAELDSSRGQLVSIWLPRMPRLDFANEEILDTQVLTDKAWVAYKAYKPFEDGYIEEKRLVLEVPKYGTPHNLTQDYSILIREWQVIPIWRVLIFSEADRFKQEGLHAQIVHVDARNGKVLKVDEE